MHGQAAQLLHMRLTPAAFVAWCALPNSSLDKMQMQIQRQ
jgi:hypothetical protein